jgi:zinc transport system permease protein
MPEILEYDFMRRALLAAVLIGAIAPAFGVFLVLRRLSLIADSLSHVALAGVAIGLLTSLYPPYIALASTSTAAISIEELRARKMLPGDAALAVFLYGSLAIAVVIISIAGGFNSSLFGFLFGSILTVSSSDLWLIAALSVAVVLFVTAFISELAQASFDADLARINGVRVHALNIGLAVITGATITLAMRVVGVLLIGALIVVPVLIALRLSTGLTRTIVTASVTGMLTAITGMVISFYADVSPGGAMVLTGIGLLILVELATLARRTRRGNRLAAEMPHSHPHTVHAHAGRSSESAGIPLTEEALGPTGAVLLADDEPKT